MADREKVIKATEDAFDLVHSDFIGTDDFNETEWEQNKEQALKLLKEHTEGIWIKHLHCTGQFNEYECSFCHIRSSQLSPYCAWCGTNMVRMVSTDA